MSGQEIKVPGFKRKIVNLVKVYKTSFSNVIKYFADSFTHHFKFTSPVGKGGSVGEFLSNTFVESSEE